MKGFQVGDYFMVRGDPDKKIRQIIAVEYNPSTLMGNEVDGNEGKSKIASIRRLIDENSEKFDFEVCRSIYSIVWENCTNFADFYRIEKLVDLYLLESPLNQHKLDAILDEREKLVDKIGFLLNFIKSKKIV